MDEIEITSSGSVLFNNSFTGETVENVGSESAGVNVVVPNPASIGIVQNDNRGYFAFCWKSIKTIKDPNGNIPVPNNQNDFVKLLIETVFVGIGGGGGCCAEIVGILDGTDPSILSGQNDVIDFQEITSSGLKLIDTSLSFSILFEGSGGELNGIVVQDGFSISYSGTFRNQLSFLSFEVPNVPDFEGFQRVLIGYSKI